MRVKSKYEMVYEELRKQVLGMPLGLKLPSIRELMSEFEVSQLTIDKALETLSKEGLVYSVPYKGIYVNEKKVDISQKTLGRKFIVAIPDYNSPLYEDYIAGLSLAANGLGEIVRVIRYDWRERIFTKKRLLKGRADGLIIFPTSSTLTSNDISAISRFDMPVVLLDRILKDFNIDCVASDNGLGGEMVARHLAEVGHRSLAILLSEPDVQTVADRKNGFLKHLKHFSPQNCNVEVLDAHAKSGDDSTRLAYDLIVNYLCDKSPDNVFTALFVVSDSGALGALRALHEAGFEVPDRVSVIGFNGWSLGEFFIPPLSTVEVDIDLICKNAIDILEKRINGVADGPCQIAVPPTLLLRKSTTKPLCGSS
jgi:DNA-binding LacI/PurR family transcriptional regulator